MPGGKQWSIVEDQILDAHFPSARQTTLMEMLPGRSWHAICWRAYNWRGLSRRREDLTYNPRLRQLLNQKAILERQLAKVNERIERENLQGPHQNAPRGVSTAGSPGSGMGLES